MLTDPRRLGAQNLHCSRQLVEAAVVDSERKPQLLKSEVDLKGAANHRAFFLSGHSKL
jgi:hypothetical protein